MSLLTPASGLGGLCRMLMCLAWCMQVLPAMQLPTGGLQHVPSTDSGHSTQSGPTATTSVGPSLQHMESPLERSPSSSGAASQPPPHRPATPVAMDDDLSMSAGVGIPPWGSLTPPARHRFASKSADYLESPMSVMAQEPSCQHCR